MSTSTRAKRVVALDWDTRRLRVVHAVITKRGPRVERSLSVGIPPDVDVSIPQQMGAMLRRVLDQEEIRASHALVDVPRDQATLNTLTLPCQVPDELPNIVAIQVAKQLPFAVSDAVIDYVVGPHAPEAVTAEVLVAAVRHEILRQFEETLAAGGLKPVRIGLRPFTNRVAACALLKHDLPERVLFLDVRPTSTEINVLRNSTLVFSRAASVLIPETGLTEPRLTLVREEPVLEPRLLTDEAFGEAQEPPASIRDSIVSSLVVEVTRSIEAYRAGDPGAKMDHVVIGGDVGIEEQLAEVLQRRLGVTTEIYNPASTFGWEPDEGAEASAFAASLGLVLGYAQTDANHFDFLHPKKTVSAVERRLKKTPLVAAVVALMLTAGIIAAAGITKPRREELARLEKQIAELKENVKENEKFLGIVKDVEIFDSDQLVWVDVLYDIVGLLPAQEEMLVTQVEFNQKDSRVVLKTRGKNRDTGTNALRALIDFRRANKDKQRFSAIIRGSQSEKEGETYPFVQEIAVMVQDDQVKRKGSG